jgi:molecular chaperone HscB
MLSCFDILSTPPVFDLDTAALEAAYLKAQRQFHPDRFVGKPQAEKMAALQKSMDINQAYETLKNPLKRAQHLLSLQGIMVGTEADNIKPSKALLMEVMELREKSEEIENADEKTKLVDQLRGLHRNSLSGISNHYSNGSWEKMAQETLRLGYIVKMLDDMKTSHNG